MSPSGDARVVAAIDVGSNSVLLLVAAIAPDGTARAVDEATETTRLGAGLRPGGPLDPLAAARTRDAVAALAARARQAGATTVWGFATGAARHAADGRAFAGEVGRAAGVDVEILTGEHEAALAYAAVAHGLGQDALSVLAIDVGGATTELTLGHGDVIEASASLPLGALVLREHHGTDLTAMRHEVAVLLAAVDVLARARAKGALAVASGGTATALVALALRLSRYDPRRVHGTVLALEVCEALAANAPPGGGPMDRGRVEILPAGACILAGVGRALGTSSLRVSDHGVRHAYLRERLARQGVAVTMRALWG